LPKQQIKDNVWSDRLKGADRYYEQWEKRFRCNELEKYVEGLQWRNQLEMGYDPYVINKFYEIIELKVAKYIPSFPNFVLTPKPFAQEWDFETAARTTQIKEDFLNTLISNDKQYFTEEAELAYKDSFTRFGIIEVGYAADWIQNPNAQEPLLKKNTDREAKGKSGRKIVDEPPELPYNERVFFKHIPAKRFRVGGIDNKYLDHCGWCGYYEFVDKDDLLALPKLMNRDKIENAQGSTDLMDDSLDIETNDNKPIRFPNSLKIWKLWDMRAKVQLVVLDSPAVTVFQRTFKRLPLIDFRPDRRVRTSGFYPIPPSYQWLSPQNEINETREQLRAHRRRFIRKFWVEEGAMDDEEIEKWETGPDGALVKVKPGRNGPQAVQDANLGAAIAETIPLSADDLNRISGTTNEEQGVSDRTTATQAKLVDARSSVRGSKDQDRIVDWFSRMGREALLIAKEKMVLGTWVKSQMGEGPFSELSRYASMDPKVQELLAQVFGDVGRSLQAMVPIYKWITSEDLSSDYDAKVEVDLVSMSQSIQQIELQKLVQFLSMMTQFPMVAFSPILIRELAYRIGYRNERVLAEFQKMALLMELGRMQQMGGVPGAQPPVQMPNNGNVGQQITQQMNPPMQSQINDQLKQQIPQMMQTQ
jgi:hypothetical protein